MSVIAVAQSSLVTSLSRYSRSWGLWLLLLVGPVGARFMIARDDGSGVQIAIGKHLPVMTSAMLGVSLGIVVSTLLLPIGFLYLRSNITRRQPWQVEEVTTASRIAITLGRFAADVIVLFGMLATLTAAGCFLGWLIVTGPLDLGQIAFALWLVAAPAVMGIAAIRALLDALPFTRRGLGEFLYLILWLASIATPAAVSDSPSSFVANLYDFAGFVRPLVGAQPSHGQDFSIGGSNDLRPGRVPLDVVAGLHAPGYIPSRIAWAGIAVALAAFAGLVYAPHTTARKSRIGARIAKLFASGPPAPPTPGTPPAHTARFPFAGLVIAEARLIGGGRLFLLLAAAAATLGLFGDYRHIGSPAALVLLIFGLAAHAGRSEARGLLALTHTALLPPMARRIAFVLAGLGWSLLVALPAALIRLSPEPLLLAAVTGGVATLTTIALATLSRSAFAPRLVLLILWYGYLSA
jgi:hypothetical protein